MNEKLKSKCRFINMFIKVDMRTKKKQDSCFKGIINSHCIVMIYSDNDIHCTFIDCSLGYGSND